MKRTQGWARLRPVLVHGLRWGVPATAAAAVALVILQVPNGSGARRQQQAASPSPRPLPVAVAEQPAPLPVVALSTVVAQVQSGTSTPQETAAVVDRGEAQTIPSSPQLAVAAASEHALPWSAATLGYSNTSDFGTGAFHPVRQVAHESRRPNSSWTSRFTEMVRDLSAEQSEARVLQFASMNLNSSVSYASASAPAVATQLVADSGRNSRALNEREFRDLDSRFGVKGSSVSIKF